MGTFILLLLGIFLMLVLPAFWLLGNITNFGLSFVLFIFFPVCIALLTYIIFKFEWWSLNGGSIKESTKWILVGITLVFLAILKYSNNLN